MISAMSHFFSAIWPPLAASIITAIVVFLFWRIIYWLRLSRLAGTYDVRRKFNQDRVHEVITVRKGNGPRILVEGKVSTDDHWEGQIFMNSFLPNSGHGYYTHTKREERLWGTHIIYVTSSGEIVETRRYATANFEEKIIGYVWQKQ